MKRITLDKFGENHYRIQAPHRAAENWLTFFRPVTKEEALFKAKLFVLSELGEQANIALAALSKVENMKDEYKRLDEVKNIDEAVELVDQQKKKNE